MGYPIENIAHAMEILFQEAYPSEGELAALHFGVKDLAAQLVFELIFEDYKEHSSRHPIDYYIKRYDIDANNRKYTRAINYSQHYRTASNETIEAVFGIRLPELERVDMEGKNRFRGYPLTTLDFLGLKLQSECKLLEKLHVGQIDDSHKVSEERFREMFSNYHECLDRLEPRVNAQADVITNTLLYFSTETHFLIDFLYGIVVAAERHGFPSEVPSQRIIDICGPEVLVPSTEWCPAVPYADNFMLMRWSCLFDDIFEDGDEAWARKATLLLDCKQLKSHVLQARRDRMVSMVSELDTQEKADFIMDNYWVWDIRPEYEWTSERIRYFRKLHPLVMRLSEKPRVK